MTNMRQVLNVRPRVKHVGQVKKTLAQSKPCKPKARPHVKPASGWMLSGRKKTNSHVHVSGAACVLHYRNNILQSRAGATLGSSLCDSSMVNNRSLNIDPLQHDSRPFQKGHMFCTIEAIEVPQPWQNLKCCDTCDPQYGQNLRLSF